MSLAQQYKEIRDNSAAICKPLHIEDYVVQPVVDVSPPKWHLGHTTWFFETFVLKQHLAGYKDFDSDYNYVFNSYYETIGARVIRTDRGNLSRPTVDDVYRYRAYVDAAMLHLLEDDLPQSLTDIITLGLNHEQQHQELLSTDIKYILGHNPLFPAYTTDAVPKAMQLAVGKGAFIAGKDGLCEIGYKGSDFCFDNELGVHRVFLEPYQLATQLVTNGEYLEFMNAGGYGDHRWWHAEGLDWVKAHNVSGPLYWHNINGEWHNYTWDGLQKVNMDDALCHISFYEAAAYAAWRGMRLPTEFEWEASAHLFGWGSRWEWTDSAYLPYPGFKKAEGAIGEYNGKFMVSQMVLRGASEVTPPRHSRQTYRNFFHPSLRWQYTGIRLAK